MKSNTLQFLILGIAVLFLGAVLFVNFQVFPIRSDIKTAIEEALSKGQKQTEHQIEEEIWGDIRKLDQKLQRMAVTVTIERQNDGSRLAIGHVDYRPQLEFFFANTPVNLSVGVEVPYYEF